MKIDAHQHFWQPARGDYTWMPMDNPVLARPYSPADLAPHLAACGVDATVLVQAAATVNESEYMLGLADATPWVAGVVGWVDFEHTSGAATLARLAQHPKFKGLRPMIQDIADVDWMLREDVQWGFAAVTEHDLVLDALGFPRHLANFLTLLKRHSGMRVVIDHCMKPQVRDPAAFTHWAEGMARLAGETSAYVKFSALVTEADTMPTLDDLRPYAEHILATFGPARILWGSDWPVARLRCEYVEWHDMSQALVAHLPDADRARIFGGTASEVYRIDAAPVG